MSRPANAQRRTTSANERDGGACRWWHPGLVAVIRVVVLIGADADAAVALGPPRSTSGLSGPVAGRQRTVAVVVLGCAVFLAVLVFASGEWPAGRPGRPDVRI